MPKFKLKKNDTVVVIAGKDKGKTGRILKIDPVKEKVLVEGVNIVKKAVKKKNQNDRGGIIEVEAMIHISNVMLSGKNNTRSRVGIRLENNEKVRYLKKTGDAV